MGVLVIAEGKTFLIRSALFVGLGSVVATIIYLTPTPANGPDKVGNLTPFNYQCNSYMKTWNLRDFHPQDYPTAGKILLLLSEGRIYSKMTVFHDVEKDNTVNIDFITESNALNKKTKTRNVMVHDQYPQSCARSCHELDWPMICRVKLTLERYQSLSRACGNCPRNTTECYASHCVTADGRERGILTANRQFPGPNLRVCQNDIIVVDIVNRLPGQSFGVHWRGQSQRETPHMDGVPMITQCPIPSFTTFQYKFRATHAGTHVWQVNTGEELLESLFGAFIVRQPESRDVNRKLYDLEDPSHIITVHTLSFPPKILPDSNSNSVTKLLINGKVQENGVPPAIFRVAPGKKYRFRVILGGDRIGCRVRVSIDEHKLLVFALDGNNIKPIAVRSIHLAPGERADFALETNQRLSSYGIRAEPEESCRRVTEAVATLIYDDGPPSATVGESPKSLTELSTVSGEECADGRRVCPEHIQSLTPIPKELLAEDNKQTFYFFYTVRSISSQTIYNTTFIAVEDTVKVPQANNLTMMFPSSPLLTQSRDIAPGSFCSGGSCADTLCECVHVLDIRLGAVVELVLVNQDDDRFDHVFHLHGHNFHVVASAVLTNGMTPEVIRELDRNNKLLVRNLNNPIVKDTVAVPYNGVVVIRFKANNPGYWLLDEEHSSNWLRGMSVVLRVGKEYDVPEPPKDFPRCGNWIGPEFFLE